MTPGKAIKAYCKWCCCGQVPMKKFCGAEGCALYEKRGLKAIQRIKLRCYDCSGFNKDEVKNCRHDGITRCKDGRVIPKCELWDYRLGKNPKASEAAKRSYEAHRSLHSTKVCLGESKGLGS